MTLASLNTKDVGEVLSSIRSEMNDPTFKDPMEGGNSDLLVLTNALDDGLAQKIDDTIENDGSADENLDPITNGESMMAKKSQAAGDISEGDISEISLGDQGQTTEDAHTVGSSGSTDATEVIFDGTSDISGGGDAPSVDDIAFQAAQSQVGDIFVAESVVSQTTESNASQGQGDQETFGTTTPTGQAGDDFASGSLAFSSQSAGDVSQTITTPQSFAGETTYAQTASGGSGEVLISPQTMIDSTKAFSELTDMIQNMQKQTESLTGTIGGGVTTETAGNYTLESLMRELLKPMLKDWLDAHLPSLVKWLVAEQIEKMLLAQGIQLPTAKKTDEAA